MRGTAQSLEVLADIALTRREGATAVRLLGAADACREQVAAHPTEAERARLARVRRAAARLLGDGEAERGERAGRLLSRTDARALARRLTAATASAAAGPAPAALTDRQLEVAGLVASGLTNRQIAQPAQHQREDR